MKLSLVICLLVVGVAFLEPYPLSLIQSTAAGVGLGVTILMLFQAREREIQTGTAKSIAQLQTYTSPPARRPSHNCTRDNYVRRALTAPDCPMCTARTRTSTSDGINCDNCGFVVTAQELDLHRDEHSGFGDDVARLGSRSENYVDEELLINEVPLDSRVIDLAVR